MTNNTQQREVLFRAEYINGQRNRLWQFGIIDGTYTVWSWRSSRPTKRVGSYRELIKLLQWYENNSFRIFDADGNKIWACNL